MTPDASLDDLIEELQSEPVQFQQDEYGYVCFDSATRDQVIVALERAREIEDAAKHFLECDLDHPHKYQRAEKRLRAAIDAHLKEQKHV